MCMVQINIRLGSYLYLGPGIACLDLQNPWEFAQAVITPDLGG